jgi:hypothetical protein
LGIGFPAGAENFSLHHRVQTGSGAHPASYKIGTRGSFPGCKAAGREADHSLPSSAEVKNAWNYNSTPPISLRGTQLKHRDNFIVKLSVFTNLYEAKKLTFMCGRVPHKKSAIYLSSVLSNGI